MTVRGLLACGLLSLTLFATSVHAADSAKSADPKRALQLPERPVVGNSESISIKPDLGRAFFDGEKGVWTDHLEMPGASFLKAHFVKVNLRAGDVLTVRRADGRVVEEITGRGPKDHGNFWGLSVFGDWMMLEFTFTKEYAQLPFEIDRVIVGDEDLFFRQPAVTESICAPADFEDVICYQGDAGKWANVLASVGVMSVGGNANTALFCSGSNVSPQNHLLTNQHCITNQAECDGSEFVFKFYRTGCNDASPPTADWVGFRCDQVVAQSPFISCEQGLSDLDFTLSTVIGDPASTFGFVEPDPNPITDGEDIYIVQHPAGRPHEITHGGGADVDADGTVLRYYTTLDTEGGSSGSPIYREADDKLVGLHHCGGCSTPATGNRGMLMSDIYPLIESFLCTAAIEVRAAGFAALAEVAGNGDAVLDPGETWHFTPQARNIACSGDATNVSGDFAVGAASAAGVTLLDAQASFGTIPAGQTAAAAAPIRFQVDSAAVCAGEAILDLTGLTAGGNPFAGQTSLVSMAIGELVRTTAFSEDFAAGIPGTWSLVDGGTGTGPAVTWTTTNPGARTLSLIEPFAIADSDELGSGESMDEELITPAIDATGFSAVELQFAHDFNWFSGGGNEQADVDVRSTATGGAWVNVGNFSGADTSGTVLIDISGQAAAQTDLQVRFHYYDAIFDWWWAVDDVQILGNDGLVCNPFGASMIFADGFESGNTSLWSSSVP